MKDVLWIMVVTITNLGYGDFTPSYWISRSIIAFMSVFGIFQTALIVGVLRRVFMFSVEESFIIMNHNPYSYQFLHNSVKWKTQ